MRVLGYAQQAEPVYHSEKLSFIAKRAGAWAGATDPSSNLIIQGFTHYYQRAKSVWLTLQDG